MTLEGDIVNVDGNGNRVAALTFGPRKTVVVVGANKVVRDLDEALVADRDVASADEQQAAGSPQSLRKVGDLRGLPPRNSRICRVYQILRRKPSLSDFTVILVGEALGF